MSGLNNLDDTLGIAKAAGELLKEGAKIGQVARRIQTSGGALTQHTAKTTIMSRVFIDGNIIDEIVIPNLLKRAHEWYAAQVVAAIGLGNLVTDKKTVEDFIRPLQTGQNYDTGRVVDQILAKAAGQESFVENYKGTAGLEAYQGSGPRVPTDKDALNRLNKVSEERDALQNKLNDHDKARSAKFSANSVRPVNPSEHRIGPMGELYEVTLTNPVNKDSVKVPLFVQMMPSIMEASIAPRFIDMNVTPSVWQRWTQYRAGELSFWKDFVWMADLAKRNRATFLKDPQAAKALQTFLQTTNAKNRYAMADATLAANNRNHVTSSNLANTVMIFSEDTLQQTKVDSGIDLHKLADRNRYFRQAYAVMLCVVDPIHQRVTIYFNGLDGEINSSYNDFKPKDSKFDPNEFMMALQSFNSGNLSRLR